MCGRYNFKEADDREIEEINKILREIDAKYNTGADFKTGQICPTNNAPILSVEDGKMSVSLMKWGFPKWDSKGVIINARSETAKEKNMFAKPLREKRCVVLSTGFYEWRKRDDENPKEKYIFNTENSPMLYMAGIYNEYMEEKPENRFTILTRQANEYMIDIHDRMPVILYKNELKNWLLDNQFVEHIFSRDNVVLTRKKA